MFDQPEQEVRIKESVSISSSRRKKYRQLCMRFCMKTWLKTHKAKEKGKKKEEAKRIAYSFLYAFGVRMGALFIKFTFLCERLRVYGCVCVCVCILCVEIQSLPRNDISRSQRKWFACCSTRARSAYSRWICTRKTNHYLKKGNVGSQLLMRETQWGIASVPLLSFFL